MNNPANNTEGDQRETIMSGNEHRFFSLARRIALKNAINKKYHFGTVLVAGGSVITTGTNIAKSSPLIDFLSRRMNRPPQQIHAEIACLAHVSKAQLRHSVLYVARVKQHSGTYALARPCAMCMEYLRDSGLKRICYSIISRPDKPDILEWGVIRF